MSHHLIDLDVLEIVATNHNVNKVTMSTAVFGGLSVGRGRVEDGNLGDLTPSR